MAENMFKLHDGWHHPPHIVVIKDGVAFGEMWLSRTQAPALPLLLSMNPRRLT